MFQLIFSIGALLLSIVILQLANSMVAPTIVLNANSAGSSLASIGMIPTIYGLGFVFGCFWARKLLKTIGHIRSFTFAAALLASLTLMMHLIPDTFAWIIFRGLMGVAIAIIMTCIDSWVGHVTPFEMRGRVMGFYSTFTKLAYVGAPAVLAYSVTVNEKAIIFSVLLFTVSLIPVCLTKLPQPSIGPEVSTTFRALLKDTPSAFVSVFVLGFTNTAVINLLPVYGVEVGFIESQALLLLTAAHIGGLILQWPLGLLSDLINRRKVMIVGFMISSVVAISMTLPIAANGQFAIILTFIWGGAALSLYSISLSHAIDHVESEETVTVCATILTTWSIGSIFGPIVAGVLMEYFSVFALYLFCAVFHGLAGIFILFRVMTSTTRLNLEKDLSEEEIDSLTWPQNRPLV